MKMHIAAASLVVMTLCGTTCAQTNSDQAPSGTVIETREGILRKAGFEVFSTSTENQPRFAIETGKCTRLGC
jgi:hypothetical protein